MIFVDSSIWIAALRDAGSREAAELAAILDSDQVALSIPVFLEVLAGASRGDRPRLRRVLTALPIYYPANETWERVENWGTAAGDAGETFGIADLLIASIAVDQGGILWSLDFDFARMARLKFVALFRPKH